MNPVTTNDPVEFLGTRRIVRNSRKGDAQPTPREERVASAGIGIDNADIIIEGDIEDTPQGKVLKGRLREGKYHPDSKESKIASQADLSALESKLNEMNGMIAELQSRIDELENR